MRIATSTLFNVAIGNMDNADSTIAILQQEISTGKMVNTPADDPVAAAEEVKLNQQIQRNTDLTTNRKGAESTLNTVDTTLSSVNTLLTSVKSELVAAGNGTYSASDRKTLASQLQTQLQDLMGYANTQDGNGEYLFSGFKTATQPYSSGNYVGVAPTATNAGSGTLTPGSNNLANAFPATASLTITGYTPPTSAGGKPTFTYNLTGMPSGQNVTGGTSSNGQVTINGATLTLSGTPVAGDSFTLSPQTSQYEGDTGLRNVQVSEGQIMATNLPGSQVFGQVPTGNGTFATAASSGNTGSGVVSQGTVISAAQLTKDSYQVQFTGNGAVTPASTNSGGVGVVSGSISGAPASTDSYELSFSTSGGVPSYSVVDNTTGNTVSSNQPYTAGSAITVNGVQFSLTGTPTAGDNFTVGPGPATQYNVLDTSTGTTVLSNQTYASGNAIQFAGMSFEITGKPNGGDTFGVAPSSTTSVFAIMQNAINALNSYTPGAAGNTQLANALATANAGIDAAQSQVSVGQSTIGGRLQQLTALDSSESQIAINYQSTLTTLTSTDMTKAISDLAAAQTSLTAAQKSFVSVESLSLFNYIQ